MIEIGKKYRLKKLKGWFENDSEEFTVVCFGENNIVGCVAPDGERYVFDKDFLIDPDKPNEIYADIKININTLNANFFIILFIPQISYL